MNGLPADPHKKSSQGYSSVRRKIIPRGTSELPQGVEGKKKLNIEVGLYKHWLYKTLIMSCGAESIYRINIIEN